MFSYFGEKPMSKIPAYNLIAFVLICLTVAAALVTRKADKKHIYGKQFIPPAGYDVLFAVLFLAEGFLLFWRLGKLPDGMLQDEASIGYEAYALLKYGTDRFGYPYPVVPITWGSGGGGPAIIYLTMGAVRLFGRTPFAIRMVPAFLALLSLTVFYLLLRFFLNVRTAFVSAVFFAFCPWQIMQNRWTLDNRPLPFFFLLGSLLFLCGLRTQKTKHYLASAAVYALCLYSYGSAILVIPVHLLFICLYAACTKRLSFRQFISGICAFLVVFLPLGLFYTVNALKLPEIVTPFFSIERFRTARSVFYDFDSTLPAKMFGNLKILFSVLTTGLEKGEMAYDVIPGFAALYHFTFPVVLTGIVYSLILTARHIKTVKKETVETAAENKNDSAADTGFLFLSAFLCAFVFSLFIELDTSRLCLVILLQICFFSTGMYYLGSKRELLSFIPAVLVCGGLLLFSRIYFTERYDQLTGSWLMPGYCDAVRYADEILPEGQTVYSTYEGVSAPFMMAMFAAGTAPEEFYNTAVFRDDNPEFLIATSFSHYVFGLPEDIQDDRYLNDIVIVHTGAENEQYDESRYDKTQFGQFVVLKSKQDG